jgi:hypothetical protein
MLLLIAQHPIGITDSMYLVVFMQVDGSMS